MSALLSGHGTLEVIQVEPFTGRDGQGRPAYGEAVEIEALVVRADENAPARSSGQFQDGQQERITLGVYVPASASVHPGRSDRLTVGGTRYLIREWRRVTRLLDGELDHLHLKCREE